MKIGDKVRVATKIWHGGLILEDEILTISKIYDSKYFSTVEHGDYIHYPKGRIMKNKEQEYL